MLKLNKKRTLATVTLTLILIISSLMVLSVEPVNAQSADTEVKIKQVTNEHLTLSHYGSTTLVMPLEKGDHIEGNFVVSNIFYYPKWPSIDLKAEVTVKDPNNTSIYDTYAKSGGSFNFTALQSGNYTLLAASNLVGELINCGAYITTSEINQATKLEVNLNYTITGAPLEITITSPTIQTSLQSNVSLDFSFNRVRDWAGYSLDGADVVSLCDGNNSVPINGSVSVATSISTHSNFGNITLTNLSDGPHTLMLYANDSYGNMASQTVAFIVGSSMTASPVPGAVYPLPILPIVAAAFIIVVILAVAFFYMRRRVNLAIHG